MGGLTRPNPVDLRCAFSQPKPPSRLALKRRLEQWGHEVVVTIDGKGVRSLLERDDHPKLAILDWMMLQN